MRSFHKLRYYISKGWRSLYWTLIQPKGRVSTIKFVKHIDMLGQRSSDRLVYGFRGEETEREFLKKIISDTWDLIDHNEWGTGLENLLCNLHEIDCKLDSDTIDLAKRAIEGCGMNYEDWMFIEDLNK